MNFIDKRIDTETIIYGILILIKFYIHLSILHLYLKMKGDKGTCREENSIENTNEKMEELERAMRFSFGSSEHL